MLEQENTQQPAAPTGSPVQPGSAHPNAAQGQPHGAPAPARPASYSVPLQPHPEAAQAPHSAPGHPGHQPASHGTHQPGGPGVPHAAAHTVPAQAPAPKKAHSGVKTFFLAFAGALAACVITLGGFTAYNVASSGTAIQQSGPGITINANTDDMSLAEAVAAKTLPSVVNINVYAQAGQGANQLQQTSLGSGVVLTADGYILTNNHVVNGGAAFEVVAEGETYPATVVGTDPSSDLAVVKVDGATLKPIEIGSSSDLVVGEWVMAAGSPFGMEQSVSTGIVSAVNRSYADQETGAIYANMIQTDAAINSGNSGGALVDGEGKLIGINTLIMSPSGTSAGVGFAIPVDYAYAIAQQIMQGKPATHAQMGLHMITVNDQIAARFGLSVDEGAYVNSVNANGPAANAGLQEGDVIVKLDNEPIADASELMLAVRSHMPGNVVKVTYIRDGQEATTDVTLGSDS